MTCFFDVFSPTIPRVPAYNKQKEHIVNCDVTWVPFVNVTAAASAVSESIAMCK